VFVLCAVALTLGALTVLRNREYANPLRLMETIVERRPTAVAHHMLGEQLAQAGRLPDAETHLRTAVAGGNSRANYLLGLVLFNQERIRESIAPLEAFIGTVGVRQVPSWLEPPTDEVLRARVVLGTALAREREWARAAEQATAALAVAPRYVEARGLLAQARLGQERWFDALREYREYLAARPDDVQGLMNLGVSLVAIGRLDEAMPVFRRAVSLDPKNPNARRLLDMAERDAAALAGGSAAGPPG
jgi:Flp pilus assembly protein TadD